MIHFGSWARGNNRPDSDVDLVVIIQDGYQRTVEYKNNQAFEIIYTTAKSALEFWQSKKDDCFNLWSVAKIIYDKTGLMKELEAEATKIINEGKKEINIFQIEQFKFSALDTVKAVEALIEKDPSTATLVLTKTALTLMEQFFDLRRLWTPAPKQRLVKIREINPELAELFMSYFSEKYNLVSKIEIVKKITAKVFDLKSHSEHRPK